jgi:tRNA(Ile)-lysidine synthase
VTISSLADQTLDFISRHRLFQGGESVLVAVSGGADSVALLDVLREIAPRLHLSLACVHVDHGLRPEAPADAEFVQRLCAEQSIPFHLERVTVRQGPPWDGLEAEARRARYAAFESRAGRVGATRIATGHTADDQAETVLMRLLQGAGPRGLAGIAPARGRLVRPLLDIRRAEIVAHLRSRGVGWVEDETNVDRRFLRNRLRHDVLPALVESLGPQVVPALCRAAALTRRLVVDLHRCARSELERMATRGAAGLLLPVPALSALSEELAAEVLLSAATELGESRPRRAAVHRAVRRLLREHPTPSAVRIGALAAERSGAWLRVGPTPLAALRPRRFVVPGSVELGEVALAIQARCVERGRDFTPPLERHRVAFDADRLPSTLEVRGRRSGDRFTPFGGTGERRLKSFLIDAGVPRWERARVPLVEAAGEIIWVAGVRRAATAPVGPETTRILEVTLERL